MKKIGFGGGCHWCTEAVFEALNGVLKVEQGFITPTGPVELYSEAVIVHYDPDQIPVEVLIEIHLYTHNSTSLHSMRHKYRSAIYVFDKESKPKVEGIMNGLQASFEEKLVTQVHGFGGFKPSDERFHQYYFKDPSKPFCEVYIAPKLSLLMKRFSKHLDPEKVNSSDV